MRFPLAGVGLGGALSPYALAAPNDGADGDRDAAAREYDGASVANPGRDGAEPEGKAVRGVQRSPGAMGSLSRRAATSE